MRTILAYGDLVVSLSLDDWETREDFLFFTVSQVGPLSLKKKIVKIGFPMLPTCGLTILALKKCAIVVR